MVHQFENADTAIEALAIYFIEKGNAAIAHQGRFTVALSGGNSPKKLHRLLAARYAQALDWSKVYFFFGDERYVPHDHPDSNYRMAMETLLMPLHIPTEHIFPMPTDVTPEGAATEYNNTLISFFGTADCSIDFILLGLGDNAHTASLFPHTNILDDTAPAVRGVFVQEVNMFRITLNAPLINLAGQVAFLVFGKDKADAVYHILNKTPDYHQYPAQLIAPLQNEADWFMDEAAGNLLK